ncbi:kallistatin-like [Suncus etruscus]|uniref:kallistatin-like n=1 Tax=Suncus etruscus TaxID=109475 RepID=UPI002110B1EC|nr:kallistatin-like [Suncus etruscus]
MTTVQVPMMRRIGMKQYLKDKHVPCSVLQLDYNYDAKMLFILPDPGKMEEVEASLTPQVLEEWKHSLENSKDYKIIDFYLPKFSISATYQLQQLLLPLGFTELFSPSANFSNISEQQNINVLQGFHKAMLEVNERGPKAGPHTGFHVFRMSSLRYPSITFNRPFVTIIYSNNTNDILFMGKVVNPTI